MADVKKIENVKTVVIDGIMGGPGGNTVDFRGEKGELLHREDGIDDFYAKNANVLMMDMTSFNFKPPTVCTIKKHSVGVMPHFTSVRCGESEPEKKSQKRLSEFG